MVILMLVCIVSGTWASLPQETLQALLTGYFEEDFHLAEECLDSATTNELTTSFNTVVQGMYAQNWVEVFLKAQLMYATVLKELNDCKTDKIFLILHDLRSIDPGSAIFRLASNSFKLQNLIKAAASDLTPPSVAKTIGAFFKLLVTEPESSVNFKPLGDFVDGFFKEFAGDLAGEHCNETLTDDSEAWAKLVSAGYGLMFDPSNYQPFAEALFQYLLSLAGLQHVPELNLSTVQEFMSQEGLSALLFKYYMNKSVIEGHLKTALAQLIGEDHRGAGTTLAVAFKLLVK